MTVKTILCRKGRDVVTIEPSATLENAIATLAEHRIGALAVLGAASAFRTAVRVSGAIKMRN
jgi:CBS domain-containing protein